MQVTIYGIKNCDTMKKAFNWLDEHGIAYTFHNYKESGIGKDKLETWLARLPLEQVLNLKSTTYRELSETDQKSIGNKSKAIKLMIEHTSLIKRPVLEAGKKLLTGFKPEVWEQALL